MGIAHLDDEHHEPVMIPHGALAADLLRGIVEAFVLREGTDYGEREYSLEQKVAHVMRELDRGEVHIIFDPISQTVNLIAAGTAALPAR